MFMWCLMEIFKLGWTGRSFDVKWKICMRGICGANRDGEQVPHPDAGLDLGRTFQFAIHSESPMLNWHILDITKATLLIMVEKILQWGSQHSEDFMEASYSNVIIEDKSKASKTQNVDAWSGVNGGIAQSCRCSPNPLSIPKSIQQSAKLGTVLDRRRVAGN